MTAGWTLPTETPEAIAKWMHKRVEDAMDEIIQRSIRKQRADSMPNSLAARFANGVIGVVPNNDHRDIGFMVIR